MAEQQSGSAEATTTTTKRRSSWKTQPSSSLQLVPETILKRRHDLDDLKRKRAARPPQNNRKVFSKSRTLQVAAVRKPETFLAKAKSEHRHNRRYRRVSKKGMQSRASDRPVYVTKEIRNDGMDDADADDADDADAAEASTNSTTKSMVPRVRFQSNSANSSVVFCVRVRDNFGICPSVKRVLYRFRLSNPWEGVFLSYTQETARMLHAVEPWVLYGTPSKAVIHDLITRRGHGRYEKGRGKGHGHGREGQGEGEEEGGSGQNGNHDKGPGNDNDNDNDNKTGDKKGGIGDNNNNSRNRNDNNNDENQNAGDDMNGPDGIRGGGRRHPRKKRRKRVRFPLSDNTVIERVLGNHTGIICIEDLVHELQGVGEHFHEASQFLCPFRLSAPKTRFEVGKLNMKQGHLYGDRGEEMDDFLRLML